MTVAILSVSARNEDEIAVTFEIKDGEHTQRESFIISATLFADMHLSVGECDRERFDAVCEAAELYRAKKRGLNILGYGASSEKGLAHKLMSKGFSKATAERAVAELSAEGYINADADACREAEKGLAKLWGKKRIAATLYQKGYSDSSVKRAIFALEDGGVDFSELCAERLRRTVDELPRDPKEKQKLIASLIRYGFSSDEIREAVRSFR